MTTALAPVDFTPPLLNPAPNGLFAATTWDTEAGPLRWLASGVAFRRLNFGGEDAFGVWTAEWDAAESDLDEDDIKTGERSDPLDQFLPMTSWGYDEGDLTTSSQAEVRTRAEQTHRLQEQNAVETAVAERMLADAGTPASAAGGVVDAVGHLEMLFAQTNTVGFVHAGAQWAAAAAEKGLIVRSGTGLKTPLGHTWVFGGGYVDALGEILVATSQPFGWRGEVTVRGSVKHAWNRYAAVAERSLVIGYEALIGAVDLT